VKASGNTSTTSTAATPTATTTKTESAKQTAAETTQTVSDSDTAACAATGKTNSCQTTTGNQSTSTATQTAGNSLFTQISDFLKKCGIDLSSLGIELPSSSDTTGSAGGSTASNGSGSTSSGSGEDTQSNSSSGQSGTDTSTGQNADNLSFEEQVVALVNEQRAENGLSPLTLSTELSNAARAKSQDMHDNNYFAHESPTYGSPFEMLTSFGISYRAAGENIAMGYSTPEAVINAWMNSSGHRANILNANYTTIGVGYVADGNYWTQEFTG